MKYLKQNNINPKNPSDDSVVELTDGTIKFVPKNQQSIKIESDKALLFPKGNNSQRPTAEEGLVRFNTQSNQFEGYASGQWQSLGGVRDVDGNTYILAESSPGANENTLFFYTDGELKTTFQKTGIATNNITAPSFEIRELSPDNVTLGDNKVKIKSSSEVMTSNYTLSLPTSLGRPGQFLGLGEEGQLKFESIDQAGNRIYISEKYGDDNNDGITLPVRTLRKGLQIASTLVYEKAFDYDEDICRRDVGLILNNLSWDAKYVSNWRSIKSGLSYYNATAAEVVGNQKSQTLSALQFLKTRLNLLKNVSSPFLTRMLGYHDIILDIFEDEPQNTPFEYFSHPSNIESPIVMTDPYNVDPGVSQAKDLLLANIEYIAEETVSWIDDQIANSTAPFNGFIYDSAKCRRDIRYIVASITYDLLYGGNTQTVDAALKYYDGVGNLEELQIPGQVEQTIAAIEYARDVAKLVAQNLPGPETGTLTWEQKFESPGGSLAAADTAGALFDAITNVIENGTGAAPTINQPTAIAGYYSADPALWTTALADMIAIDNETQRLATEVVSFASGYRPNGKKVTVQVSTGEYNEENPLIIPDNVSVIGDSLRSCIIRPINANKDMFRVRNGCYFTEFTFRDKIDNNGIPVNTWNYAFSFDQPLDSSVNRVGYTLPVTKPVISISPYIQNCSIISFLGGSGVLVDGEKVLTPNRPINEEEVERPINLTDGLPEQGKSMVANAFTMLSFGGTGWRLINDAYAQIVSCFQIFMLNGTYCQSGGYVSITNSATNFGKYALRASGYSPNAFTFDRGYIAGNGISQGVQTLKVVGYGRVPVNHFILRFRNTQNIDITETFKPALVETPFDATTNISLAGDVFVINNHGLLQSQEVLYDANGETPIGGLDDGQFYYVNVIDQNSFTLFFDEEQTLPVDLISFGTGTQKFLANVEEFFVDTIVDSHNVFQSLNLAPGTYTIAPGDTIEGSASGLTANAFVYSYNNNPTDPILVVAINKISVGASTERIQFEPSSVITSIAGAAVSINVTGVSRLTQFFGAEFTVKSTIETNVINNISALTGLQLYLHRPSIVNSSSHTWEYAGSGIDYNALPQNGGKTDVRLEQFSQLPGRVYSSGTNELGDFKVGDFILAENKTGNISFRNKVVVSELTALKLSLSDIEIEQISIDGGLGDNEIGGPKNTRLSTQLAVRTFLNDRLGEFIDKDLATNSVPNAVVQLNGSGQINSDLIPAIRTFAVNSVEGYRSRLNLSNFIPPANVLAGDLAAESYQSIQIVLAAPVTLTDGSIIEFNNGTIGSVIGNPTNDNTVFVGSTGKIFNGDFLAAFSVTLPDSTSIAISSLNSVIDSSTNYYLATDTESQFLILNNSSYSFTVGNSVSGIISGASGTITQIRNGVLRNYNPFTVNKGTGGLPASGTKKYYNIPLEGGTGTGALANLTVIDGQVELIEIVNGGSGYAVNDVLNTVSSTALGIADGFDLTVSNIESRLYITLNTNTKFIGTPTSPEFIIDNTGLTQSVTVNDYSTASPTGTYFRDFDPTSAGGEVNFTNSRITLSDTASFNDGDSVIYNTQGGIALGGLVNGSTYYVKIISGTEIEIYREYSLSNQVAFSSDGTGTHRLEIHKINLNDNRWFLEDHGYETGDAVRISFSSTDTPVQSGGVTLAVDFVYFIGSVSQNCFSLHEIRSDALNSVSGLITNEIDISARTTGTTNATFLKQNVRVIGAINTSSLNAGNWGAVSSSALDASSIVSGTISPSRLANTGTATDDSFLRGDSVWAPVVESIKTNTDSPITLSGNGSSTGYYNDVTVDINLVDSASGTPTYSNLGAAQFLKSQFEIGTGLTAGQIAIKSGVIDAGLLDGLDSSYFLDPRNLDRAVPANKGGTGLNTYAEGDIIYANSVSTFGRVAIGSKNNVLAIVEPTPGDLAPAWVDELTVSAVTIDFARTDTTEFNVSSTIPTIIDSFNKTTYRSATYTVQITNLTDSSYLITQVMLVHNGVTIARVTEFGSIATNGVTKGSFSASIAGNDLRLIFRSVNTDSLQLKLLKTYITP